MIGGHVTIIAVPSTRGENRFAIDTPVRRTVPQVPEDDLRYEMDEGASLVDCEYESTSYEE